MLTSSFFFPSVFVAISIYSYPIVLSFYSFRHRSANHLRNKPAPKQLKIERFHIGKQSHRTTEHGCGWLGLSERPQWEITGRDRRREKTPLLCCAKVQEHVAELQIWTWQPILCLGCVGPLLRIASSPSFTEQYVLRTSFNL